MVIRAIFPWCFTPELYAGNPDYIQSLANFVLSRPAQPLAAFMQQLSAVIDHDVESQLGRITAPTQITFGRFDFGELYSFCGSDEPWYPQF
jgi:pimeloyl-ACP methyl ester carboxylesterase